MGKEGFWPVLRAVIDARLVPSYEELKLKFLTASFVHKVDNLSHNIDKCTR